MRKKSLLIVDDDPDLREFLLHALTSTSWSVETAATSDAAISAVMGARVPDLVVLDVGLPDADGWSTLVSIRAASDVPVIMLTAQASRLDAVRGLELGADDFVAKPFEFLELKARIEAVLRRYRTDSDSARIAPVLSCPGLVIDESRRLVEYHGKTIELSPREFDVLILLASRPGHFFPTQEILRDVWSGSSYAACEDVVKCIYLIRKRFQNDAGKDAPIMNRRGFGYCLGESSSD